MAKLSAHGTEIARAFLPGRRILVSYRSDGVTLARAVHSNHWIVYARKKADISIEQWTQAKLDVVVKLPRWAREVKSLPSMRQLQQWAMDRVVRSAREALVCRDRVAGV